MAILGSKPCKAFGSFLLCVLVAIAVWKEITLGREMCESRSSQNRRLSAEAPTLSGDSLLVKRPARDNPARVIPESPVKNYMLKEKQFGRLYSRIEDPNVTLFLSSPPSSGAVNFIEMFYALPIAHEEAVIPLVDNAIISSGNVNKIRDYLQSAIHNSKPPALVHTHAYHVDFLDSAKNNSHQSLHYVLQVSIVRDPIERAVSLYYYARANNSKDSEAVKKWRKSLTIRREESYDECVNLKRFECVSVGSGMRLVHHFCGYDRRCKSKTRWAFERAKYNIEKNYYIIGLREEFEIFVNVMERRLPAIFSGGSRLYYDLLGKGKITRKDRYTAKMPSQATIAKMRDMMALDIELYQWIKRRFDQAQRSVGLKI